jgi:hypothetical protein
LTRFQVYQALPTAANSKEFSARQAYHVCDGSLAILKGDLYTFHYSGATRRDRTGDLLMTNRAK